MSSSTSDCYWWPCAISTELPINKILARQFFGLPLVLFRTKTNGISVLVDRCSHRFAPLSDGRIVNDEIECPYHGWRFNTQGQCTQVPGLSMDCSRQSLVKQVNVCEMHGMIWVNTRLTPLDSLPDHRLPASCVLDSFYISDTINANIAETAENFLDGFHTHFVHKGWIRRNSNRQDISACISSFSNGIEVSYSGEKNQNGFISRLFERERGSSVSRFYLPGLAEIEYRDNKGRISLLASLWLVPSESEKNLRAFIRINTAKGILPAIVKNFFLRRLFDVILRQDKRILELTSRNTQRFNQLGGEFANTLPLNTANDLVGPAIKQLLDVGELEKSEEVRIINL